MSGDQHSKTQRPGNQAGADPWAKWRQPEAPAPEASQAGASKVEAAKAEAPKAAGPKTVAPKAAAPKAVAPTAAVSEAAPANAQAPAEPASEGASATAPASGSKTLRLKTPRSSDKTAGDTRTGGRTGVRSAGKGGARPPAGGAKSAGGAGKSATWPERQPGAAPAAKPYAKRPAKDAQAPGKSTAWPASASAAKPAAWSDAKRAAKPAAQTTSRSATWPAGSASNRPASPSASPASPWPATGQATPKPADKPWARPAALASASTSARPAPQAAADVRPAAQPAGDTSAGVRLSKVMSERGLCSRREADLWIERGWVFVDGERITELGTRIDPSADISLAKEAKQDQAQQVTIILHKPVGYVSGQPEPGCTPAVALVTAENQVKVPGDPDFKPYMLRGLAPAGRLDIDSTGLLVLTQDGRIAKQLIGDDSQVEKEYLVRVSGQMIENGLALLNHGLELDGKPLKPARVKQLNEDQLHFILREGKKRQIRRMCELVGLRVTGLKRVRIGHLRLGDLPLGKWRVLRPGEGF